VSRLSAAIANAKAVCLGMKPLYYYLSAFKLYLFLEAQMMSSVEASSTQERW